MTASLLQRARGWLRQRGVRVLEVCKDGGPESTVWAYVLVECKWLGSVMLLRFENGSRDAYHSHAFNCVGWLLSGGLVQDRQSDGGVYTYLPSVYPIITLRSHLHKVVSVGRSVVLTIRGPWANTWQEQDGATGEHSTLTNGRVRT